MSLLSKTFNISSTHIVSDQVSHPVSADNIAFVSLICTYSKNGRQFLHITKIIKPFIAMKRKGQETYGATKPPTISKT
jgi:hypothetical protein